MQKVLQKMKKCPGKSWNLNQFFCWEPWIPHFLPLIVLNTEQRVIRLKKNWKLYIIYVNRKIYLSKRLTKATLLYYLLLLAVVLTAKIPDTEYHRLQTKIRNILIHFKLSCWISLFNQYLEYLAERKKGKKIAFYGQKLL